MAASHGVPRSCAENRQDAEVSPSRAVLVGTYVTRGLSPCPVSVGGSRWDTKLICHMGLLSPPEVSCGPGVAMGPREG